eukprot:COSAG02_NODE_28959_length_578_cov_149.288100_1_plen_87_part_01
MAHNVTCDEEFVALIRGATALDFGTVLEQQQQRTGRQPKRVDEHANEAEADESKVGGWGRGVPNNGKRSYITRQKESRLTAKGVPID